MENTREKAQSWWSHATVYQVYIRSFADGNGDGIGDIEGLLSRMDYLVDLGVDAIWINPWYESPLADGGYDVSDYRAIESRYGTLAHAEELIGQAHDRGIKVIADLVPNHTSEKHAWFREATSSNVGHQSRDRYHIRDGKGLDGELPPTNWESVFGGPAWTRLDDGQWYLHLFAPEQPDLNWNNAEVKEEFASILRFWLDRGIDGFRIDVAHGLIKDETFPDIDLASAKLLESSQMENHPHWDRDEILPIVASWRKILDDYDGERMLVAEAWVHPTRVGRYLQPGLYQQSFNFDFLEASWDREVFHTSIQKSIEAMAPLEADSTWVLSNHDVMRESTRYGLPPETDWRAWPMEGPSSLLDAELGSQRARAAALCMLGLPGSCYIYQGQELGLPEVWDLPEDVLDDPVWERSGGKLKGRDGCRVPLPWKQDGASAGFSESGERWLPQPEHWGVLSVEAQQKDAASTLNLYKQAVALRKKFCGADKAFTWLEGFPDEVLAYKHGDLSCLVNFGSSPLPLDAIDNVLLKSDRTHTAELAPDTAVWFL